ncbi:MAG: hypothetical protein RR350_05580 [Oscillibacter sp.]
MKRKKSDSPRLYPPMLALAAAVLCLWVATSNLDSGRRQAGLSQLEDAVRRSAVACYAAEGVYPPTLAYLQERYGLQVDETRYTVVYEAFAENLMPEVTVLENPS